MPREPRPGCGRAVLALLALMVGSVVAGWVVQAQLASSPCGYGNGPTLLAVVAFDLVAGVSILRALGWKGSKLTVLAFMVAGLVAFASALGALLPAFACIGA